MNTQKIYYKKVRDLGGIFSATFGFIKQNFKPLYGALLFFAGPILLICATVTSVLLGPGNNMTNMIKSGNLDTFWVQFLQSYLLTVMVLLIGSTVHSVIVNRIVIENEKLKDEKLNPKHGVVNFWGDFWLLLGNTFIAILIMVFALVIIGAVFAGLIFLMGGGSFEGGNKGGIIAGVMLVLFVFLIFILIFVPILSYLFVAAMFVSQRDKLFFLPAMNKVFYYMKNHFWNTWMVSFIGMLTHGAMNLVVQIPVIIITLITTFSRFRTGNLEDVQDVSITFIIITAISHLLTYGVLVVYHLINIYQFTNLEEKKEGISIEEKINQIR